jgi:beta-carotene ketolase (CrtW type)
MWQEVMNLKNRSELFDFISGIFTSLPLLFFWIGSLIWLLSLDISQIEIWILVAAVFVRTFLHTGLFITAHDAMHRTVFPKNHRLNDLIGSIATTAYALLSFQALLKKHRMHHRYPASANDPDFYGSHDREHQPNALLWYLKFMQGYLDRKQLGILLVGMAVIFAILNLGFHISNSNLILFWILPMLCSSIQLFYFGTFLPHRQFASGYGDLHCARSSNFSKFWSFITCYHFGYHWEHHEYPHLPWYKLPSAKWD